jgi:hypothetical protein
MWENLYTGMMMKFRPCLFGSKRIFFSLLSRTVILSLALHGHETRSLTPKEEHDSQVPVFENKMIRKYLDLRMLKSTI